MESIEPWNITIWPLWVILSYVGAIFLGMDLLSRIIHLAFRNVAHIPIKGKHLDDFSTQDNIFILINKFLTVMFTYHVICVTRSAPSIVWEFEDLTVANTLGSLVAFYAFYDFFYMWFHRLLHVRFLYGYVHKHHHRQKAPSRGNLDAINVHPFEFVVGEYLHLLTVVFIPCHIYTVVFFIAAGGFFASLNHTRYDVNIPGIYSVKVHDVHHR